TEDSLAQALGLAGTSAMQELLTGLLTGDAKNSSRVYRALLDENIDLKKLCDQILDGFYRIINSIDDQSSLYKEELIQEKALDGITVAELFWMYETLVKDFGWALTSLNPDKVVLIVLQKICLRRSILTGQDLKLDEVKQVGKPEGV